MMRYALNPSMPVLLRPDGTVQVGWDPRRAVLVRPPSGLSPTALAALLRTLQSGDDAGRHCRRASESTRVELIASLVDAGLVTAAKPRRTRAASIRIHGRGPLSDLLAGGLRCSGARVTHSSQTNAGRRTRPTWWCSSDFLVADPRVVRELHAAGFAHLPVRVRDGTGLVGPLVIPGLTSCLGCADLHRSDRDAAWPAVAAQLRDTVGSADRATVLATAALALNQVDRVIRAVRGGEDVGDFGGAAADSGHHAGVRRQRRCDRGAPVVAASPLLRAENVCCQVVGVRHRFVMDDGLVTDIKRGRAARNAKLASLPVGMAGRAALGFGKRLTGKSKDEVNAELMDKAAQQLFTVLGELKGGAMKVGQALSVMEAAIPEQYGKPYREALTKLQREAPPLPAAKVHRVLDAQLGTKWRDRFASFDDTPVASASIGQVHKAVWSDGREVAVKIQYPGADEALRADLKTMQRMVSVIKQLSPGADVQGVVDELIERTEMELDYRLEADNQRAFAKAYEGHPHFVVPHIVASAPKVVIQEWIEGIPLSVIIREGTTEQRDLMGTRLFELTYDAPRRLEMMHGDAHPGNFMLLPDDKMGVIDFGAVAPMPGGIPVEIGHGDALRARTTTTTTCCRPWRRSGSSRRASRCPSARWTTC